MGLNEQIEDLVQKLAETKLQPHDPPNSINLYSVEVEANAIRRNNLLVYLRRLAVLRPNTLIVGESAGRNGTLRTGIPITDEETMLRGIDGLELFGEERGYRRTGEFGDAPRRGKTTHAVWKEIVKIRPLPLLWDAFPFYSHEPGNQERMRTNLTSDELDIGPRLLQRVLELYQIDTVVALGWKAHRSVRRIRPAVRYVHHPGRWLAEFRADFRLVVGELQEQGLIQLVGVRQ